MYRRLQSFEDEYYRLLEQPSQRAKYAKVDIDFQKASGRIDLSLLTYENQQVLKQQFRRQVLQVDQLFNDVGLPGMEFKSSNLYSALLKYDVADTSSPMGEMLNRMFFNVNPLKDGFESINFGMSNMMDTKSLRQLMASKSIRPEDLDTSSMLTFDVETTGVTADSQIRQFSYKIGDQEAVTFNFRNPLMDTSTVTKSGISYRMSDFVNMGQNNVREMSEFAEAAKQMFNEMENVSHISAHNARFDLGQFGKTLQSIGAFDADEELRQQYFRILDRTFQQDNYLVDTAESMRSYFTDEASRVVGESGDRASRLVSQLLGPETITKAGIGGSSAIVSVENLALNSNLFQLLEKHDEVTANEIAQGLKKGSHNADVDIAIQASLEKMRIRSELNDLGGDRLTFRFNEAGEAIGEPLSEFETYARSRVFKSQAITPVTNIASVQHISDAVSSYLRTNEGMQGVQIRTTGTSVGLDSGEGILSFNQASKNYEFRVFGSETAERIQTSTARQYISRTLNEASSAGEGTQSSIRIKGRTVPIGLRNIADESILDLGMSFGTATSADSMIRARSVLASEGLTSIPSATTNEDLLIRSLGLTNEQFGVSQSFGNIIQRVTNKQGQSPVQQVRNPLDYNVDVLNSYTANVARAGLPFATIGDANRIMSVGIAEATASIGEAAGINLTHGRNAKLTTETALSFFKMQNVTRIGTLTSDTVNPLKPVSKVSASFTDMFDIGQDPTTGRQTLRVKAFQEQFNADGTIRRQALAGMDQDIMSTDLNRFTLSFVSGSGEGDKLMPSRVNLVYKVQGENAKAESRRLAEYMLDNAETFQDTMRNMASGDARMGAYVREMTQFVTMPATGEMREKVTSRLAEQIEETGVIFASVEGDPADAIKQAVKRSGIDMVENDVRLQNHAMRIAHADAGSGTLTMSAMSDLTADRIVGRTSQAAQDETFAALDKATELNEIFNDSKQKRRAQRVVTAAQNSAATDEAVDLSRKPAMDFSTRMTDFYIANKPKIGFAALGLAVAGAGYYIAKDRREQRLYEETREVQNFEPGNARRSRQSFNSMASPQSTRRDPLVTAGVVGNLDRNKINHTKMGPNKYNHLYGN